MDRLLKDQSDLSSRMMRASTHSTPAKRLDALAQMHMEVADEAVRNLLMRIFHDLRELQLKREGIIPTVCARHMRKTTAKTAPITQPPEQPTRLHSADPSSLAQGDIEPVLAYIFSVASMFAEGGSLPDNAPSSAGHNTRPLCVDTIACAPGLEIITFSKDKRRNDLDPYSPTLSTSSKVSDYDYPSSFS